MAVLSLMLTITTILIWWTSYRNGYERATKVFRHESGGYDQELDPNLTIILGFLAIIFLIVSAVLLTMFYFNPFFVL